jgi:antitoxin component YwqK of YwqJK toxin-antitoxin module
MRHFLYTLFLFYLFGPAFSQSFELSGSDTVNRTDEFGKKQGRWIFTGKHKPGTCYKTDQKAEEGVYTDNKKTGLWVEYHCNGNPKSKITFANGRPEGSCQSFYENGNLSEEGTWKNNRWMGNYKLYHENGKLQHDFVFNEMGRREGPQKYFHENGQLAIEGSFDNGKESGTIREYYENGDLKAEKSYNGGEVDLASVKEFQPKKMLPRQVEGPAENAPVLKIKEDEKPNEAMAQASKGPVILNGEHTLYNRNRQITKSGLFKDNRFITGKAYFYDENGILQRIAVYRNGTYIGDAQPEK